jgi:hypothetical protein
MRSPEFDREIIGVCRPHGQPAASPAATGCCTAALAGGAAAAAAGLIRLFVLIRVTVGVLALAGVRGMLREDAGNGNRPRRRKEPLG